MAVRDVPKKNSLVRLPDSPNFNLKNLKKNMN